MPATTFAELLDLELGRVAEESSESAVPPPSTSSLPVFRSFVRIEIPFVTKPAAYGRAALTGPIGTSTAGEVCARLALESPSIASMAFSQAELRSAFRQLAREHHPDRHPDASSVEAAQWSGSFAEVERRYRRLAAALAARH
jgi:hypothetical protein